MLIRNPQTRWLKILGIICIGALLAPGIVVAQQEVVPLKDLREQILLLEKVDRDPQTREEVRALNATLLADRRKQLANRLAHEIEGLKDYEQTIQDAATASERDKLTKLMTALQQELDLLKRGDSSSSQGSPDPISVRKDNPPAPNAQSASNARNSANSGAVHNLSNHSLGANGEMVRDANVMFLASCYPDAPKNLTDTARGAAELFVTGDDASSQFGDLVYFAITHTVAVDTGHASLLKAIEVKQLQEQTKRTDKQVGATTSAAGSTTLAEKPAFAEILGFAVEHGGIQQAVTGTTLNLSTTPYAFTVFNGGDTQSNYKKNGYLTRLGISADFNIQNQDSLLANARRSQLADWGLHLRLSKDRSTRSDDAEEIWNGISSQFAQPSLVITDMLKATFQSDVELEAQRRQISDRLLALTSEASTKVIRDDPKLTQSQKIDQIAEKIVCRIKTDVVDQMRAGSFKISSESKDRIIRVTLPAYAEALQAKEQALKDFDARIDALSFKPIFSLAYNDVRPTNGANYSELKMLYQKKTGNPMNVVANASISLYHKPNLALKQQTVRDFSATLSFEGNAGRSPFLTESKDEGQITYSFTGRYQRLLENRVFPGRKSDIATAQFKLNIPMFAGTSFPFSVTFANASELIKEKHVRANFGFSLDADKLLKALALSKLPSP